MTEKFRPKTLSAAQIFPEDESPSLDKLSCADVLGTQRVRKLTKRQVPAARRLLANIRKARDFGFSAGEIAEELMIPEQLVKDYLDEA